MKIPVSEALESVRLTLGRSTTADEVDKAAAALVRSWRTLASGHI
jgi:cysteine sulfinate desulfinase/cysteine desulfurase-like protein